jgi:hypothetical protein
MNANVLEVRYMLRAKYIFILIFILSFTSAERLRAQSTPFEEKIQSYKWTVLYGDGTNFYRENIWAWLEEMKNGNLDADQTHATDIDGNVKPISEIIHNMVRAWGTQWYDSENYAPYGAWRYAEWTSSTALIWILFRYANQVSSEDLGFVEQLYHNYIHSRDYSPGSENAQAHDMVGRYLYAQYHQDVTAQWSYDPPLTRHMYTFEWEGRTYTPGQTYNSYELTRDWLFYHMRKWVLYGNGEFDSPNYTWSFIHSFITLYEFAEDPEIKKRAKMVVDFILLDSVLDFSGNQWGGAMGRTYESTYRYGVSRFYWDCFWHAISPSHEPVYNILFSSYRLPDLIYDIGDLSDEPDNYYHLNMEYNVSLVNVGGSGKYNYVTKFYNLGGRLGDAWQLCIKSDDEGEGGRSVPFRLWVNRLQSGEDVSYPVEYEAYLQPGQYGYQYRNAMFIRGQYLHYALGPNEWDADDEDGDWRFFKEGRTMIAVQIFESEVDIGAAVVEVAIEGVDYQDFNQFKYAVLGNAGLDYIYFTTSRGDVISYEYMPEISTNSTIVKRVSETEWEEVWDFPFPRIRTVDHLGREIVRWDGQYRMILTKHGDQMIYDFENWTVETTEAPPDTTPPAPPVGVSVTRRE